MSRYFICPNCKRKMLLTGQSDVPMSCPKCKAQFDVPPEVVDTGTSKGRVETRNNKGQFQKRTPDDNNKEAGASISVGKPQIKININRADPSSKKKEEKEENSFEYKQEKPEPVALEDNQPSNDELMAELERLRKENAEFREKAESKKSKSETLDAALSSEEMLDQLTGESSDLYEQSEIDELEAFLNETPTQTAKPKAPVSKSVMSKISEKITSVKEETESSEKIVAPSPFSPEKLKKEVADEDVPEKTEDLEEREDVEEAEIPKKKEPVKRTSLSERVDIYYEEDEAEEDNDAEPSFNTDEIEELSDEEIDDDDSLESGDDEEGYNPNYDKYYDDILPELLAEKDRIPKESIIRAVVMIVTVIIAAFVAAYRIV